MLTFLKATSYKLSGNRFSVINFLEKGGELVQKRIVTMLTAMSLMLPAIALAASGDALFLQSCGACHKKGGKAAIVNPADKAGTVWDKYFARGRHPVDMGMSDADLQTVVKYLVSHAADSDQPAAAVIPK